MPNSELEADGATLNDLLGGEKEFLAPIFQRIFVWRREERERLWEDIDAILDGQDDSRFLGAIVLRNESSRLALAAKRYWIIDGQQRLTTLFLLLMAIARRFGETGRPDRAAAVVTGLLLNQVGDRKNAPKLRPTSQDLHQFNLTFATLVGFSPQLPQSFGDPDGRLIEMYHELYREIVRRGGDVKDEHALLDALLNAVGVGLKFVQIVLSDADDPNQVYNSLNERGQRLTTVDLVRNEVFQRFKDNYHGADALYNSKWLTFERALGPFADSYFFPYALTRDSTITKARVFRALKEEWVATEPAAIVDSLTEYLPMFRAVAAGDALSVSPGVGRYVDRLFRMPAPAVIYPYTMKLLHETVAGEVSSDAAARCLAAIESFLVRRAFAGFEPTGLHAVFKGLWAKAAGDVEKIVAAIDDSATIEFPDDARFREDIQQRPFYRRRIARYVLREYEAGLPGGDPLPLDVPLTIDHVMPQNRTSYWQAAVSDSDFGRLVDTWANLVPLSNEFNASKSDAAWSDVRVKLADETIFRSTRQVAQLDKWDASRIEERASTLAQWATKRWPKATIASANLI